MSNNPSSIALIIESDPVWQGDISRRLQEEENVVVKVATTCGEARSMIESQRFDFITLDLSMGARKDIIIYGGRDFLGELQRRAASGKRIPPIIIVSGREDTHIILDIFNHYDILYFARKSTWDSAVDRRDFSEAVRKAIQLSQVNSLDMNKKVKLIPKTIFVSKSFHDEDSEINLYFEKILESLGVNFVTGEPYTNLPIPEKIDRLIRKSDILVAIFTIRGEHGQEKTTSSWILGEVHFARRDNKGLILIVEEGIKSLGGLELTRELIYFQRNNPKKIAEATWRFLEAIKEHGFVKT